VTEKHIQRTLPLGALLLAVAGGFLPWVYRDAVALQLTAPGLAEFVKFLPEVRRGELAIARLNFLLPLLAGTISLPLLAANRQLDYPRWAEWLLRLAVVPLALALLSPVWTPGVLVAAEFRLQTLAAVVCLALSLVAPWFGDVPLRWLAPVTGLLGLFGTGLAFQQFFLARPALADVYRSPVEPGWGAWLTWLAAAWLVVGTAAALFRPAATRQPRIRCD
jgi:hypothetical protein